jgi:hypothetical protein
MNKVLFLDVDGVLNNVKTKERILGYIGVDAKLANLFTRWHRHKKVPVVLSSTWRLSPEMHPFLKMNGIEWFDVTPKLNSCRGLEIAHWLNAHQEITHYAILDDTDDMMPGQKKNFVHVSGLIGLTRMDLQQVNEILEV